MSKSLTLEEARQEFIDRGLTPLFDEYKNSKEYLIAKTQEGYIIHINLNHLKQNKKPRIFNKSNPYTIQNIKLWCKLNNKPFELLNGQIYKGNDKKLKWQCLKDGCGEIFEANLNAILSGNGCGFCRGLQVGLSNCLAIKRPDLILYLKDKNDGLNYTLHSKQDISLICPFCGFEKNMIIDKLAYRGFSCPKCGDGISYPEKFMFNLLEQLNLDFSYQLSKTTFKWCNNFRYDFYIKILNCIIETHGRQHYESIEGIDIKKIKNNDNIKIQLALDNNINHYIILDCRKSELEWIKNNIINSELPKLLNFNENDINWFKCHEYACSSLVKEACDLWNSGIKNSYKISNLLKKSRKTIQTYLKQGAVLNWCDYDPKKISMENNNNFINFVFTRKIICNTTGEIFNTITEANKIYNINITSICACCRNKQKSAGKHPITGEKMVWMYYEDWETKQNQLIL